MGDAASAYQTLAIDHRDGIDWLTFNRPEQFNALNGTMMDGGWQTFLRRP